MNKTMKKIQLALVAFGVFVVCYNLYEFITKKYSTTQGVTFIIESLAGILLIFLPQIVRKIAKLYVPDAIVLFYWFFLFISVFLGTGMHLISIISFWDKILHFVSPMLLTAVGYGIAGFLLKKTKYADVSPWLFLLFGFAFAGLCGVFWEFWEFICDSLGNMNLQRYNMSNGQPFIGRAALMDTMGDLFTNTLGAFVMGVYTYIRSKGNPEYLENYAIKRK